MCKMNKVVLHVKKKDDPWVFDKASGHLFCKYCGENYLNKKHKPECQLCKKEKCGYCGNGTDPDDICDDCWNKMHEESK